jgi:hypothetical protein|tara:strand:- start:36 stop:188 length:153 start_codon:yes stop_codon:yes gene_type:complete
MEVSRGRLLRVSGRLSHEEPEEALDNLVRNVEELEDHGRRVGLWTWRLLF